LSKYNISIPVGPIWNQKDAETKCPIACAAHSGKWNGQWTTVVPNKMCICICELDTESSCSSELLINVMAGFIKDKDDANVKCPIVCASYGGEWTGLWFTPKETWNKMSVCECKIKV
jgi:hypothetical protein